MVAVVRGTRRRRRGATDTNHQQEAHLTWARLRARQSERKQGCVGRQGYTRDARLYRQEGGMVRHTQSCHSPSFSTPIETCSSSPFSWRHPHSLFFVIRLFLYVYMYVLCLLETRLCLIFHVVLSATTQYSFVRPHCVSLELFMCLLMVGKKKKG